MASPSPYSVRDAVAEDISTIRPGQTLAFWYSDDNVWHERIALWPVMTPSQPPTWWIVTPDLDIYPEQLDLNEELGPAKVRIKGVTFRYWSRFGQATYRFSEEFSDEDLRRWIKEAMDEVKKAHQWEDSKVPSTIINRKGEEISASGFLGRLLVSRRVVAKGRGITTVAALASDEMAVDFTGDLKDRVKPILAAPDGYVWVAEEFAAGKVPGEELDVVPGCGVMIDFDTGLIQAGGQWIKGKKKVEEVHQYAKELQDRKDEEAEAEGTAEAASEDARVLPIDYDGQGERFKDFKVVIQESEEYSFKDWPMEGPLCALHLLKQMHRSGGTPKGWLQTWARFKGIQENDRIMFELRTLVDSLEMGCCYDQVNVPALAAFETIARRVMAIVDAFSAGSSASPDWGAAKIITNYRGPEDVVSPQLRQWAARRGKEEVELHAARTKMRDARKLVTSEEAGAIAEGSLPAAGPPKGPKEAKGKGRGLTPPAQE